MTQPAYRPGQYGASVNLVNAAVGAMEIVRMARFIKAHPEVLTDPRPAAPEPDYYGRRRPVAAGSGPAPLLGLKAGFNLSNITGGGEPGFTHRSGFSVGLMADVPSATCCPFIPSCCIRRKAPSTAALTRCWACPSASPASLRLRCIDLPLLLRAQDQRFLFQKPAPGWAT
ncbi:MAG: hypothetical protein WKG07_03575 [Hymenobacter sp.]